MQSSRLCFSYFRDMNMCEVVGLRFLQGPETDQATVQKIRDAIREQREITVQLINYTKSGKFSDNEHFKIMLLQVFNCRCSSVL